VISETACQPTYVRVMFHIMDVFAPESSSIARPGFVGSVFARKMSKTRDIVNFMNFTSGLEPRLPGKAAVGC
jgi:hypothetical protein